MSSDGFDESPTCGQDSDVPDRGLAFYLSQQATRAVDAFCEATPDVVPSSLTTFLS